MAVFAAVRQATDGVEPSPLIVVPILHDRVSRATVTCDNHPYSPSHLFMESGRKG